jgi:hypothetical protein
MTTHHLCRVTEIPSDLGAGTVTAAPLIPAADLRRLAGTAEHRPPGAGGSHLWLTSGEVRRRGNQLDSTGGRERR